MLYEVITDAIGDNEGTIKVSSRPKNLSPTGVLQIKNAVCRKRHELVDRKYQIDGKPSITMRYRFKEESGLIHLDPTYGSDDHQLNGMRDLGA